MNNLIEEKLKRSFSLYSDLLAFLPEPSLSNNLPGLPSNELGQQLWCVVGARNSYLKALKAGEWTGFECRLAWEETGRKESVRVEFESTAAALLDFLGTGVDCSGSLLLDLLEHEVQHQGQLIRYLYGLKLDVPVSWKERYNLD